MQTFIHSFIYAADQITFYEKTSKNPFRHIISKKKRREIIDKFRKYKSITVSKELLIEFITIYNGSYDTINFDNISSSINESTKVYTLKIVSEKGTIIQINTINGTKTDLINITINRKNDSFSKVISCNNAVYTDGETKEIVDNINGAILEVIEMYMLSYVLGEK